MKKTMLNMKEIAELRILLEEELKEYKGKKHIKLNIEPRILEQIIFREEVDRPMYAMYKADGMSEEEALKQATYRVFAIDLKLLRKLDFTGISFDKVDVCGKNFIGTRGIKINPQTVAYKNFFGTTLTDVEIIGPFNGCAVEWANFQGSRGAKINPQTVQNRSLAHTVVIDAEIIGSLDNCWTEGTIFDETQSVAYQVKNSINEAFNGQKRRTRKNIFKKNSSK